MANSEEIRSLTGLRGLACVYVMLYHFGFAGILPTSFAAFAQHGYLAVDIFFVLSGFVMAMVYADYFVKGLDLENYKKFIARRVAKIYPLYIFMTFFFLWFFTSFLDEVPKNIPIGFIHVLANILCIQNWGTGVSYVGPAWSISTEWAAYLLFPLLLSSTLYSTNRSALVTLGLSSFMLAAICILPQQITGIVKTRGPLNISDGTSYAPMVRCITEFTIGMIAYRFYSMGFLAGWSDRAYASPILAAAMTGLLFIGNSDIIFVTLIPFLLISIADDRHIVARFLSWRPVYFAGTISYSLYLIHGAASWMHFKIKQPVYSLELPFPNLMIISFQIVISVVLASLAYFLIEKPGQQVLRKALEPKRKTFSLKGSFMKQAYGGKEF